MDTFFTAILDAMKEFFAWILQQFMAIGSTVMGWITSAVPASGDGATSAWALVGFAVNAADQWCPIHESISLAVTGASFVVVYLMIKVAIKLIP